MDHVLWRGGQLYSHLWPVLHRPKYDAKYLEDGKEQGIERVLQAAFGKDQENVLMSKPGVLASSLVVTSYQLDFDRPFIFYASKKSAPCPRAVSQQ